MKTKVGLTHEPSRKLPWLVYWWGAPDSETGKQKKYSKAFQYKRKALKFQASKQSELDQGGPRDKVEDVKLGRLLDEYLESRVAGLSHMSQVCYKNTIRQLRDHFTNSRSLRTIERRHAETFMVTRKRRDNRSAPLSQSTKRQHLKYARAIFAAGIEWGYLDKNPFVPARSSGTTPLHAKAKSKTWHHLTPKEFARLMAVVTNVNRRAAYWLMYGCGMRPGEASNITLDRVDLHKRSVRVANRAASTDIPPFTVKSDGLTSSDKERCVPIPESALPDIVAACEGAFKSGGFLVLSPERFATVQVHWRLCREGKPWGGRDEHRPWQNRDMLNNLLRDTKGYLKKAGVELTAPFTLTTFRKSFGQNHANAGTPPRTLSKIMGHSDVSTTMEFYNRVTDANERAAGQAMDKLLKNVSRTAVQAS